MAQVFDKHNTTLEEHLRKNEYRLQKEFHFDSFTTVKRMALRGLGIALLPTRLAQEEITSRHLISVQAVGFPRDGFAPHSVCATLAANRVSDVRLRFVIRELRAFLK